MAFDRITRLAARLFNVPIALVSLLDEERQWFKSCYGLNMGQTGRDISFCGHTILSNQVMTVTDAAKDMRFANSPLVVGPPYIRFYAGAPLQTADGFNLGTLCIKDTAPREFSPSEAAMLADLAALVMDELELRRLLSSGHQTEWELVKRIEELTSAYDQVRIYTEELGKEIAEREQTEEKLRQRSFELQAIFETFPDLFFRFDAKGNILDYHASSVADLTLLPEKFLGHRVDEVLPSDVAHKLEEAIAEALQRGGLAVTEYSLPLPHGEQSFEARLLPLFGDQVVAVIRNITQRKEAEELLRQSEARFRALATHAPVGIFQTDTQGNRTFVNKHWCEIAGRSPDEAMGSNWATVMHPNDRERILAEWTATAKAGKEFALEYRYQRPDGTARWVFGNATPLRNEAMEIIGYLGTITDITERKQAEQALAQQVAQLALINDISNKIAGVLELESLLDRAAQLVQKMFGYHHVALFLLDKDVARLKAIAGSYTSYFPAGHSQHLSQGIIGWVGSHGQKIVANDIRTETRYISLIADNTKTQAELCLPIKVAGQTVGVLDIQSPKRDAFSHNDVTAMETLTDQIAVAIENARLYQAVQQELAERKKAEEALDRHQAFLRQVIDMNPNFIFARDLEGRFTLVNQAVAEAYGTTVEKLLGKVDADFNPDPVDVATIRASDLAVINSCTELAPEIRKTTSQGQMRWLQIIKRPLLDEHGRANQVLGFAADITALKQAEEALRESETHYRGIVEDQTEMIVRFRPDGTITFVNEVYGRYYDKRRDELIGHSFVPPTPNEDWLMIRKLFDSLGQENPTVTYEHRTTRSDGEIRWQQWTARAIFDPQGQITEYQAVGRDITDRRQAEEALQQSERQTRALLDAIPDLMFRLNREGTYLDFRAERHSDLLIPPETIIGTNIYDVPMLRKVIEQIMTAIGQALETGQIQGIEYSLDMPGGLQTYEARVVASGQDEVVAIVRNITQRKQVELLEQDRNRVLEMVTQNQPLEAILSELVQLVERQQPEMLSSILLLCNGQVYHGAAPHLPQTFTRTVDGLPIHQIVSVQGRHAGVNATVYRGETVIVSDIAQSLPWSEYQELALSHGLQAYWSIPIYSSDGAMLGIFASYYNRPGQPGEADIELVKMAGRLAAIAIEQRQLADQLTYQAQHDALTGLPNRLLFRDRLQQAIVQARQQGRLVGLLYIDLDRFKLINDTLGHAAGDRLLYQVTQRLQACIRSGDTLARMGGDEFTVVLNGLEDVQGAIRVAQRILQACQEPFSVVGHELFVTASIGVSFYPTDGDNTEELMRKADQALYRAKERGKNSYQLSTPAIDDAVLARLSLESQLRGALGRGELLLYYQPQIEVNSGQVVGFEALLRWRHPELGLISPASFIPLAEESGLIVPIGSWVLREACRQSRAWQEAGYPRLKIAVNVSTLQFAQADFIETVVQALNDSELAPNWLQLELTESLLMHNHQDTAAKLAELRRLGVTIAIDDFGTGYSSLAYLRQLPIDALKIAQPFVREIGVNLKNTPNDLAIVTAVTNLAHSLGMRVIAEGVETKQQLAFLDGIGCNEMQGYLVSPPLPTEKLEAVLKRERKREEDEEDEEAYPVKGKITSWPTAY
jgi:diguanylate cyclase (GGDEF)-like protein/PAS domain S-box-containing protein